MVTSSPQRRIRPFVAALSACLALSAGARAAPPALEDPEEERARDGIERDDATARRRAQQELREGAFRRDLLRRDLELARKERDKVGESLADWGVTDPREARVAGDVWINLGPNRSDFSVNGARYTEIDSGRARQIIPHPADPRILFMATSGGGVWKSYDAGGHWAPLTDRVGNTSVGALAMDPSNPDILWLGLGDPFDTPANGVFHSSDGGTTWSDPTYLKASYTISGKAYALDSANIRDLKVDPKNSANVMVASDVGFFRSTDGGTTFTHLVLPGSSAQEAWSIAWMGGTTWLLAGRELELPTATAAQKIGFWRSTDSGATWTDVRAALTTGGGNVAEIGRCTLAVAASTTGDPTSSRAYMICANRDDALSKTDDCYRTDDGGVTFSALGVNSKKRPTNPNDSQRDLDVMHAQAWYNQAILVDPTNPNVVFVGGNLSMIRTRDAGLTWSVVSDWLPVANDLKLSYIHADFHAMAASVTAGVPTFYFGSDGGLFRSTDIHTAAPDAAHVEHQLNIGLASHLIYNVACAHEEWPVSMQGWVIGGLQDNGTRLRDPNSVNGPDTFNQVVGGDGIGVQVSRTVTGSQPTDILASVAGGMRYSSDGGNTWINFSGGLSGGTIPFFVRYAQDVAAVDGRTFLTITQPSGSASDGSVFRSRSGAAWELINGAITNWDGAVGPSFLTHKGAASFPRGIATHAKVAGMYGMFASAGLVFISKDAGATWKATRHVGVNPTRPTRAVRSTSGLAFDPSDATGNHFYVSVEADLLYDWDANVDAEPIPDDYGHLLETKDGGQTWTSLLGGQAGPATRLPNVRIESLRVDPNDAQTIYVGNDLGLYRSTDGGKNFSRLGQGLPLVRVSDICIGEGSGKIVISTYGRGFWQLNVTAGGATAGLRGSGDTDYNLRVDGFDLLDLAASLGTSNKDDAYRQSADLTGKVNLVDDDDLKALLVKFGGTP